MHEKGLENLSNGVQRGFPTTKQPQGTFMQANGLTEVQILQTCFFILWKNHFIFSFEGCDLTTDEKSALFCFESGESQINAAV